MLAVGAGRHSVISLVTPKLWVKQAEMIPHPADKDTTGFTRDIESSTRLRLEPSPSIVQQHSRSAN